MDNLTFCLFTICDVLAFVGLICVSIAISKADKSIKEIKKELEDLKKELKK